MHSFPAPTPASSQNILSTPCRDMRINGSHPSNNKWFYSRGKGACVPLDLDRYSLNSYRQPYQIVYTFQVYFQ